MSGRFDKKFKILVRESKLYKNSSTILCLFSISFFSISGDFKNSLNKRPPDAVFVSSITSIRLPFLEPSFFEKISRLLWEKISICIEAFFLQIQCPLFLVSFAFESIPDN